MNILITGDLSSMATALGKTFSKEKHKTVFVSDHVDELELNNLKGAITHSFNPANEEFREVLASYKFNIIIFIATREEQQSGKIIKSGEQLDGLRNALELCKLGFTNQFFYISSTEVYGSSSDTQENTEPKPETINGHAIYSGEQYCKYYANQYNLNVTVLRVPYVYGPDERNVLLYKLISDSREQKMVTLPSNEDFECSFLHTTDIADLILRAIDDTNLYLRAMDDSDYAGFHIVNLATSKKFTFANLVELLYESYPKVEYRFSDKDPIYTRSAIVARAKDLYGWIDLHELQDEISNYVTSAIDSPSFQEPDFKATLSRFMENAVLIKWIELLFGAVLMQFLSEFTGTLIQFKYVDFRLLFVVLMGLVYGIRFGLLASVLASLSVFYTWYTLQYDWALLAYNVGNWFPFAIYFSAGIITGYTRDKTYNTIEYERTQKELIHEKYQFLFGVFEEIRNLKDLFREQLIGYRDSFGKIYNITRELGTLHEEEIYIKALSILEDVLENKNVAIYSLDPNRVFARLHVNSKDLNQRISKSIKISDYKEVKEKIDQGEMFQNTSLIPNYPAYVAPIMSNSYPFNVPVALVVIWDAKYEQYSTYFFNLFKVIRNLIQDSLVRATTFMNMNYEKIYIPGTNILNYEAFLDTLRVSEDAKKKHMKEYQLLKIHNSKNGIKGLSNDLLAGIRAVDSAGMWSDGNLYVLLSQANYDAVKEIIKRLSLKGIQSENVDGSKLLLSVEI